MNRGDILIVPACEPARGGGHLCRCIALTVDLRASGQNAWLFLPEDTQTNSLFQSMDFNPAWRITSVNNERRAIGENIEFVVLDRFQTPADELLRWKKIAPVVGIDEGGAVRDSFDFLIDILVPEKMGKPPANIASASLLKFPPQPLNKRQPGIFKVLVSFGQEDAAGLGTAVASSLSAMNDKRTMDITLLRGALASGEAEHLPNVRVMEAIPKLVERLGEYDLVITHYGITAYEALYAGTAVLLASPTPYHTKLAKAAGFFELKMKKISFIILDSSFLIKLKKHCKALAAKYRLREGADLAALCGSFLPQVNRSCPVCGANAPDHSVCRFSERTYRRCLNCGVIFMDRSSPPPFEYGREYFFESYKKQYGKTYLEDFANIKEAGKRRLKVINSFLPAARKDGDAERTLLDIGCAYGPFLAAAREEGFSPEGIDPAQDAVRYVQQELALPAVQGFFPNSPPSPCSFDVVTLWFVIEHFTDCARVLAEIKKTLKPGGILAFSTPSFSGVSGRSSLRRFLSASPADHFTVWSPEMCKKALALAGFKVKKTVICGHHPQRFPLLGKLAKSKKSPLYLPLLVISKIFGLGDTFEVYAAAHKKS